MKKIFIFGLTFIIFPTMSSAYELPSEDKLKAMLTQKHDIEVADLQCNTIMKLAEIVMDSRQNGVSIDEQLDQNSKYSTMPQVVVKKERNLILEAYKFPQFETKPDRFKVTKEFSLNSFFECRKIGL